MMLPLTKVTYRLLPSGVGLLAFNGMVRLLEIANKAVGRLVTESILATVRSSAAFFDSTSSG